MGYRQPDPPPGSRARTDSRPEGDRSAADRAEVEFRMNSARTGAWVTLVVCVPALVYALSTPSDPARRRLAILVWAFALIGGLVAFLLPWRRIIESRWREAVFLAW